MREFKALADGRAKKHYTKLAKKLAAEDGLLALSETSGSQSSAETISSIGEHRLEGTSSSGGG